MKIVSATFCRNTANWKKPLVFPILKGEASRFSSSLYEYPRFKNTILEKQHPNRNDNTADNQRNDAISHDILRF
jgi:hypothetical protein